MNYSAELLSEWARAAFESFSAGKTDEEVRDELSLPEDVFRDVLLKLFDAKAEEIRNRPTEHTYVRYILDQLRNVRDLTNVIEVCSGDPKSASAMVSAIRARSEIQDKVIDRGEKFGIIKSAKDAGGSLVAGVVIAELTNVELKKTVIRELAEAKRLMGEYGETSFIDVETGPIHRGPALPAPKMVETDDLKTEELKRPKKKKTKKKQRLRSKV